MDSGTTPLIYKPAGSPSITLSRASNGSTTVFALFFGYGRYLDVSSDLFFHGEKIFLSLPAVFQAVHQLANEMDSEPADGPFFQALRRIGFGEVERVERLGVVFHFNLDFARSDAQTHAYLVFPAVEVTVRDHVCDDLLQRKSEIVHDLGC